MGAVKCLRCGAQMDGPSREKFQLGEQGAFGNHWAHLMAGALEVDIYCCPKCGKLELFTPYGGEQEAEQEDPSAKTCPDCGLSMDLDHPSCPCCGYEFK